MSSGGGSPEAPKGAPDSYYEQLESAGQQEEQMKEELFNFYKTGSFKGYDRSWMDVDNAVERAPSYSNLQLAKTAAGMEMVEPTLNLAKAQTQAQQSLVQPQTDWKREQLQQSRPLLSQYYQEAGNVDEDAWADRAQADVAQQFANQRKQIGQNLTRTGAAPGGGRMAAINADMATEQAKATAGAKTSARRKAKQTRFSRLSDAVRGVA